MLDIFRHMSDSQFFILFLHVIALAYMIHIMMIDHPWPIVFENKPNSLVVAGNGDKRFVYPIDIMHRIRSFFGVYTEDGPYWYLKNITLWTCPYCLGFRINILFVIILNVFDTYSFLESALLLLAAPFIAGVLVEKLTRHD